MSTTTAAPEIFGANHTIVMDQRAAATVLARAITENATIFWLEAVPVAAPDSRLGNYPRNQVVSPAAAITEVRTHAKPGDVLVLAPSETSSEAPHETGSEASTSSPYDRSELLHRAQAWGVSAIWVGVETPPPGAARVRIARSFESTEAQLRTLTDELLQAPETLGSTLPEVPEDVCITCSDEGRLGEIHQLGTGFEPGQVRTDQGIEAVDLSLISNAAPFDLVLIHAGLALQTIEVLHDTKATA